MQRFRFICGEKMEAGAIIGLSVTVILISALLMERFRLPMVIGVLIAGSMVGPVSPLKDMSIGGIDINSFIIHDPTLVEVFALLGAALILFGIGLEFSIIKIWEFGLATFVAAVIKVGMLFAGGWAMASLLSLPPSAAVLLGFLLSFSSTPVIIKILEGHGKLRRPEVPFIIAVLILEDLIAVFLMGIMATSGLGDPNTMAFALFKVMATFVFAYMLLSRLLAWLLSFVEHSDELLVLFVVSAVLVISYVSEMIGLGFSVGAFLAGSTLAGTAASKRVEEIIRPFNSVFSSFFFFSIGMLVDFGAVFSNLPLLCGLLAVAVVWKFISSTAAAYISGFNGRSATFAAAALLPLGELSLVIGSSAAVAGIIPYALVGMLAFLIVLTSLISVVAISSERQVYEIAETTLPSGITRQLRNARSTSIGMQRVVQDNSRYSSVISRLPTIGGNGWGGARSSHEQFSVAVRNTLFGAIGTVALYLLVQMSGAGQIKAMLGDAAPIVQVGFFAVATLFLSSSAKTFECYTSMLKRAGKLGFALTMSAVSLIYFGGAMVFVVLAAITNGNPLYLALILPCTAFGLIFGADIFREGRLFTIRWR